MKTRLFFAIALLVATFTTPILAVYSGGGEVVGGGGTVTPKNCTFTCSTGWTGTAWAASAQACADGCRAMCNVCASSSFSTSSTSN